MPSTTVGVDTARLLLDLALQKEATDEGGEVRQRAINQFTGSSIHIDPENAPKAL